MRPGVSRAGTGGDSNAYATMWPGRPWPRGACASSIRNSFPSRSKRPGRMGPATCSSLRWNYWKNWRLWSPAPVSSPALPRGSGPQARYRIVPAKPVEESTAGDRDSSAPPCAHRPRWAILLARVFSSDLSACAACGGRLRIVAALTGPASIRTCLEGVGLPAVSPPRPPLQPQFEFAA